MGNPSLRRKRALPEDSVSSLGRALSGTTFPNTARPHLHQGCFLLIFCFGFELKFMSFHVIPQHKRTVRERLRCSSRHYVHFGKHSGAFFLRRLVMYVHESLQSDVSIFSVKYLYCERSHLPSSSPLHSLTIDSSSSEDNWISRMQYTCWYF